MFIYYVYAYLREDGSPYYIGKGKENRAYKKHRISIPKDKSRIIIMESNLTEFGAFALERFYIRWYGRKDNNTGILRNLSDGGEGQSGFIHPNKGGSLSTETRKKISESTKGRTAHNKGKPNPAQSKKFSKNNPMKNSEIAKKVANKNKGKPAHNKITKTFILICEECNSPSEYRDTVKNRRKRFCGKGCAASHSNRIRYISHPPAAVQASV